MIYGPDGKVAWDEVWTTFCDLALAGGPPHRGKYLQPVSPDEVAAEPDKHKSVVAEIIRAIRLTTGATLTESDPGWVGMKCSSIEEASWLQFAVTAENVAARRKQRLLQLPAGPEFRVEKEIKNVVVAVTKTLHYWDSHLTMTQQSLAGEADWEVATPADAASPGYDQASREMEAGLTSAGFSPLMGKYSGWVGIEAPDDVAAVWLLRAVLVERVLARREEHIVYLPIGTVADSKRAERVVEVVSKGWDLWVASSFQNRKWARTRRRSSPSR